MSPRPRQASDAQIIEAAVRAMTRVGPRMTLADVAREAGLSAAALVQRFGSKRGLLLAMAAQAPADHRTMFASLRTRYRSPLRALLSLADCMMAIGTTPAEIANSLAFLQIDLTDPDFHRHAAAGAAETQHGLVTLIRDAIAAGELVRCDAARLARALQATMSGSLLGWAIVGQGSLRRWMKRDFETVLRPYVARPALTGTALAGAAPAGPIGRKSRRV
jgi:AcrR family transcriptional regulator